MTAKIRTRRAPWGKTVHDIFISEGHPWRAAGEFWLYVLPGHDCLFTDAGNAEDWEGFINDVAKKPTDNFAIIESALEYYAEVLDGARALAALAALDRLTQDWAERSANAVQRARDMIRRDDHD